MTDDPARYKPIESYGVIGDLHTVALVGDDGSIDFMCFPHFDSPTVFASLLDADKGGRFELSPQMDGARRKQLYLPDTNVLLTRALSSAGVSEISDYMPVEEIGWAHNLVRRVKTIRGEVRYRMVCAPRFDYGRADHEARLEDGQALFISKGADQTALRLRSSVPIQIRNGAAVAEFALRAGEHASFILEEADQSAHSPCASPDYVSDYFKATVNYWRRWLARSTYRGRWREMVDRSALALKLLTSQEHGSLVAAPTFGLPEDVGGVRNWDYRYTWIRDASFTIYAFMRLGFYDEAKAFNRWVEARCKGLGDDGSLQIMYGLNGRHELTESHLEHLEGYRGSSPVRIGNGAYDQLQLDIYGELMDSVYLYDKYGEQIHHDLWHSIVRLVNWVESNWNRRDEGIWEVRSGPKEFLYSRLMCWVALDRACRLAQKRSLPAPLDRWRATRDTIYRLIFDEFWNERRQAFVQHRETDDLDAANLMMPLVRFISPTDPRWLSTLRAIEQDLVDDALVYRYRSCHEEASDGLEGDEGTFSICSFWYAESLSRAGRVEEARLSFEKTLSYSNHVGLFSEQLGSCGEHLGNYPQALTHLALISAAYELDRRLSPERR